MHGQQLCIKNEIYNLEKYENCPQMKIYTGIPKYANVFSFTIVKWGDRGGM